MASDYSHASSRFSIGRILKWGGIAILVSPLILFLAWRGSVAIDINRLRQKSIDRGEPQTMAEMAKNLPTIADKDNAAEAILDIWTEEEGNYWTEWHATGRTQSERNESPIDPDIPFIGETTNTSLPWPETELTAARAFSESRRERNKKMKLALARPHARYPVRYIDGFDALLPHLSMIRDEIKSMQMETLLAIQEGRTSDAIKWVEQMVGMTRTLKVEPFLISQLVRAATAAITLQGVEQIISWHSLEPAQLIWLRELVGELQMVDAFHKSMLVERAVGLSIVSMGVNAFSPEEEGSNGYGIMRIFMRTTGLSGIDQRLWLNTFDQVLILGTNLNSTAFVQIVKVMDDANATARRFPPKIFSRLLLPSKDRAAAKFQRIEAKRRLMLIALSIESYRLSHDGRLPENLEALDALEALEALEALDATGMRDELLDPFDDEPIRFQPRPNGYLLYSVGKDLQDNQGQTIGNNRDISLIITHHYETPDKP